MPGKRVVSTKHYEEKSIDESVSSDNGNMRSIAHIFQESEDIHAHERLIVDLKINFYEKLSLEDFNSDVFLCLRFLFLCDDRQRTEKPFLFFVKFIMLCFRDKKLQKRNEKMFRKVIHFNHHHRCMSDPMVRYHVVQFQKIILSEMTDSIDLSDTMFQEMQRIVISRLWDTKPYVRAEAATASSRLQDPESPKCPIVIGLMHLSRYDNSHLVRLAATQSLAITTKTLPYILHRCYDVNDSIRKKAYELLTKWKILKPLTIYRRLELVESGLNDKEKSVQNACIGLLKTWFGVCNNDPVLFLKRFDVENSDISTKQAFMGLLKNMSGGEINSLIEFLKTMLNEKKLIQLDKLNGESAFFWRHLISFLNNDIKTYGDVLEQILPNMHDFNDYLKFLFMNPVRYDDPDNKDEPIEVFSVLKQLLPILKFLDIFDEHNRKDVVKLMSWCLASRSVPFNYVDDIMKLLVKLEKNNTRFCDMVVEIINDLLYDTLEENEHDQSVIQKDSTILAGNIGLEGAESTMVTQVESVVNDETATVNQPSKLRSEESIAEHALAVRERIRMKTFEIAQLQMQIIDIKDKIEAHMQKDVGDDETIQLMEQLNALKSQKKSADEEKQKLVDSSVLKQQQQPKQSIKPSLSTNTVGDSKNMEVDTKSNQQPTDIEIIDNNEEDQSTELNWNKPGMENIIIKACCITTSMIQASTMLWKMPSSLRSLYENVILVCVQHTNLLVRRSAFVSMGLCCLLDKDIAVKYYRVFMQGLKIDHESIKEVAVESLVDLFIRFGIEPFQNDVLKSNDNLNQSKNISRMELTNDESFDESRITFKEENEMSSVNHTEEDYNKSTMELFNPIICLLNNKTIRTTVAIGLSKLIYNQKLMSSKLLSRLLLLWFSPDTIDQYKLRAHISSLFTSFCLSTLENQQVIVSCFLPTIRSLINAPDDSPLSKIDIGLIISFFEQITDSRLLLQNRLNVKKKDGKFIEAFKQIADIENPCHDELAIQLINQILRSPQSTESRHFLTMLSRLRLSQYKPYPVKEISPAPSDDTKENEDISEINPNIDNSEQSKQMRDHSLEKKEPGIIEDKPTEQQSEVIKDKPTIPETEDKVSEEEREKLREINRQLVKLLPKVKDKRLHKDLEEMHIKLDRQIQTEESKKEGGLNEDDMDKTLCNSSIGKASIYSNDETGSDNSNPPTLLESQVNLLQSEIGPGGGGHSMYLGSRIGNDLQSSQNHPNKLLRDLGHRHLKSMRPGYALTPTTPSTATDLSMTNTPAISIKTKLLGIPLDDRDDPDPSITSDDSSDVVITGYSKELEEQSTPEASIKSDQNSTDKNVRNVSKSPNRSDTSRSSTKSNSSNSTIRKPSTPKKPRKDNSKSNIKSSPNKKDDSLFKVPKTTNVRLTRNSSSKVSSKSLTSSAKTLTVPSSPRNRASPSSLTKKPVRSPRKPLTTLVTEAQSPNKTVISPRKSTATPSPPPRSRSNPSRLSKPDVGILTELLSPGRSKASSTLTRRASNSTISSVSSPLKRKSTSSSKTPENDSRATRNTKSNVRVMRGSSKT